MKFICRIIESILQSSLDDESDSPQFATSSDVLTVIEQAVEVFSSEPAVLQVSGSYVVVGDIHGNLDTVIRIFNEFGYPDSRRFIFLGDYVDRGPNSCEVVILLYAFKVLFPRNLLLLRGNHEFGFMNEIYGFRQECFLRFLPRVYSSFIDSFSKLPVCAVVNGRIFCVHGGLRPNLSLCSITKNCEDLLWSDPRDEIEGFSANDRGRGFYFGCDATTEFVDREGLNLVIRSHEHCSSGYFWPFGSNHCCLTIFSSLNYCGCMNDGGVCLIDEAGGFELRSLCYSNLKKRVRLLIPIFLLKSHRFEGYGVCESEDLSVDIDAKGLIL
jgi:diadenosine tetraphosphatase ApaH/serine/threonine PP2A family protein phosphatase